MFNALECFDRMAEKTGIVIPELYLTLYSQNMIDWYNGWNNPWEKDFNWYTHHYPKIKNNMLLFLSGVKYDFDYEPFSINDFDYEFNSALEWAVKFIPFARTGCGDLYCFYTHSKYINHTFIGIWEHDTANLIFYASSFEIFICKMYSAITDLSRDTKNDETLKLEIIKYLSLINISQKKEADYTELLNTLQSCSTDIINNVDNISTDIN